MNAYLKYVAPPPTAVPVTPAAVGVPVAAARRRASPPSSGGDSGRGTSRGTTSPREAWGEGTAAGGTSPTLPASNSEKVAAARARVAQIMSAAAEEV